ncbi:hypothetical protein PR048_030820 [Dryococelus australis]|uniref:Uncharacterized protein n=1 Tax=Dryococelus australis TaxID=614101 RepID=A0ABQ9GCT5_9NEOP|nr:hypothetical protein PR048_030820 [Dryococelus australis]
MQDGMHNTSGTIFWRSLTVNPTSLSLSLGGVYLSAAILELVRFTVGPKRSAESLSSDAATLPAHTPPGRSTTRVVCLIQLVADLSPGTRGAAVMRWLDNLLDSRWDRPHIQHVPDDAARRRVFSGISRYPHPFIPTLLHTHFTSPSSALKTSMLRIAQISSLTHILLLEHYRELGKAGLTTTNKRKVTDPFSGENVQRELGKAGLTTTNKRKVTDPFSAENVQRELGKAGLTTTNKRTGADPFSGENVQRELGKAGLTTTNKRKVTDPFSAENVQRELGKAGLTTTNKRTGADPFSGENVQRELGKAGLTTTNKRTGADPFSGENVQRELGKAGLTNTNKRTGADPFSAENVQRELGKAGLTTTNKRKVTDPFSAENVQRELGKAGLTTTNKRKVTDPFSAENVQRELGKAGLTTTNKRKVTDPFSAENVQRELGKAGLTTTNKRTGADPFSGENVQRELGKAGLTTTNKRTGADPFSGENVHRVLGSQPFVGRPSVRRSPVRQLASHPGEPGSVPDGAGFLRDLPPPRPFIPALLHTHLTSPSSALKTSMLRAAQIFSLTHSSNCRPKVAEMNRMDLICASHDKSLYLERKSDRHPIGQMRANNETCSTVGVSGVIWTSGMLVSGNAQTNRCGARVVGPSRKLEVTWNGLQSKHDSGKSNPTRRKQQQ